MGNKVEYEGRAHLELFPIRKSCRSLVEAAVRYLLEVQGLLYFEAFGELVRRDMEGAMIRFVQDFEAELGRKASMNDKSEEYLSYLSKLREEGRL